MFHETVELGLDALAPNPGFEPRGDKLAALFREVAAGAAADDLVKPQHPHPQRGRACRLGGAVGADRWRRLGAAVAEIVKEAHCVTVPVPNFRLRGIDRRSAPVPAWPAMCAVF